MGQPVKQLSSDHTKIDLDRVWAFLWGSPTVTQSSVGSIGNNKVTLCAEAVCVLLSMVRKIVHCDINIEWLEDHPVTIIQVLFSLYHNLPDFMQILMLGEVISSLASILFPPIKTEGGSGTCTPEDSIGTNFNLYGNDDVQLTSHSVRKFVIDLLRVIVVDSLCLSTIGKTSPVIDLVLDASPVDAPAILQNAFQTEIISALIEHLLAADVLVGEQAALPIVPLLQSHIQNIPPNVFYLTSRIVDKMWQGNESNMNKYFKFNLINLYPIGSLNRDPHEVFEFVVKLIAQAKRRSSSLSLEQLHHSLNRIILYLVSRSTETVADQMAVLEALHKLTTNRLLIFGAGNHELDFIGCLTYCLLQLTVDMKIVLDCNNTNRSTTWHINPNTEIVRSFEILHCLNIINYFDYYRKPERII